MTDPSEAARAAVAEVKGGITPYLIVDGAMKAADFYQRAFAAELAGAMPVDGNGRTMHVHLYINGGSLMMSDHFPEHMPGPAPVPSGFTLTLQVADVDAWIARAAEAGAEVVMPAADMFWGARYGQVRDPFGVMWGFNQPL